MDNKLNMFNLYPQDEDYVPNNTIRKPHNFEYSIVIGSSVLHTFALPLRYYDNCKRLQVVYKQSVTNVIVKDTELHSEGLEIYNVDDDGECNDYTYLGVSLTQEETSKFDMLHKFSCFVEVMVWYKDDSCQPTRVYPVKLIPAISANDEGDSNE